MFAIKWLTEWNRRFARSVRKRGIWGTIRLGTTASGSLLFYQCQRYLTRNPFNPFVHLLDRRYDWRHAVDTAGIVAVPLGNDYSPVSRLTFLYVLRQIEAEYSKFVFIDFGCGKGKPCLLAAEFPFKAVIGVEVFSPLARIATENLSSYRGVRRCNAVQIVCINAAKYMLPHDPAICYFYDPFDTNVMTEVLDNIRLSLIVAPREVYIICIDPIPTHRQLMDHATFLAPLKQTAWCCIYKALQGTGLQN